MLQSITTNLEFSQWLKVFGNEQQTRGPTGPAHPPCPYPGHERGKLTVPGEYEEDAGKVRQVRSRGFHPAYLTKVGERESAMAARLCLW
jgi:hypothetical protein